MADLDVFHTDEGRPNIEDMAFDNGMHFWYASDVAAALGYHDYVVFSKNVLNKAIGLCMTNNFPVQENFVQCTREREGVSLGDMKISRFAFLLIIVSSDVGKPEVQQAQGYFAAFADAAAQFVKEREVGDRLDVRGKISGGERDLNSVAKSHGIQDFSRFHNAGYLGMYNMGFNQLRKYKGIPNDRSPLDFMGQRELAAQLFRINETKERIKARNDRGDPALQRTAENVGREVREFMTRDGGSPPESLPIHKDIKEVQKTLKGAKKELIKIDKPKKGNQKELPGRETIGDQESIFTDF